MRGTLSKAAAIFFLGAGLAGCATTDTTVGSLPPAPVFIMDHPADSLSADVPVHFMPKNTPAADAPLGYVSFCVRFGDQCTLPAKDAPQSIVLTPAIWDTLNKVNLATNESLWPEDDKRHYGRVEFWTIPTDGYGDCEDSALTKRKALIGAGLPAAALRVAVVITPRNTRHAVLSVVTDRGDFVLDNLNDQIRAWDRTGYTWIERQDPSRPSGWVSLRPTDRMLATANADLITGAAN
ncbi:MAG: transglutaminase-like cysteine peptidase [Rhizomicrobium sp.]